MSCLDLFSKTINYSYEKSGPIEVVKIVLGKDAAKRKAEVKGLLAELALKTALHNT